MRKDLSSSSESEEIFVEHINDNQDVLSAAPEFTEDAYIEINNNIPYFATKKQYRKAFEIYSELDELGRCGVAYAIFIRK